MKTKRKSECDSPFVQHQVRRTTDYWTEEEGKSKLILSLEYPEDVDAELVPLLDLLNSIPGMRTLFSCCGHKRGPFYMVIAFTSLQAKSLVENYFRGMKHVGWDLPGNGEDCILHSKFDEIEDFYTKDFLNTPIFENTVGFYSTELGMKGKAERVKDYKQICKFLMKLVPSKHW